MTAAHKLEKLLIHRLSILVCSLGFAYPSSFRSPFALLPIYLHIGDVTFNRSPCCNSFRRPEPFCRYYIGNFSMHDGQAEPSESTWRVGGKHISLHPNTNVWKAWEPSSCWIPHDNQSAAGRPPQPRRNQRLASKVWDKLAMAQLLFSQATLDNIILGMFSVRKHHMEFLSYWPSAVISYHSLVHLQLPPSTFSKPIRLLLKRSLANHFNYSPHATSTCLPISSHSPVCLFALQLISKLIQTRSRVAAALTLSSNEDEKKFLDTQFDKFGWVDCPYWLHRQYAVNGLSISDNTWTQDVHIFLWNPIPILDPCWNSQLLQPWSVGSFLTCFSRPSS